MKVITNVSLWRKTLILGMAMYLLGQGLSGKSLHLPVSFAINLKLLLKNSVFRNNWGGGKEHALLHTFLGGCKYQGGCGQLGAQV